MLVVSREDGDHACVARPCRPLRRPWSRPGRPGGGLPGRRRPGRSCQAISASWAVPVAPSGCPRESRPPLGLTGCGPSRTEPGRRDRAVTGRTPRNPVLGHRVAAPAAADAEHGIIVEHRPGIGDRQAADRGSGPRKTRRPSSPSASLSSVRKTRRSTAVT